MRIDSYDTDIELDDFEKAIYQQGRTDVINEIKKGLIALKDRGYKTYYIDDELQLLDKIKVAENLV